MPKSKRKPQPSVQEPGVYTRDLAQSIKETNRESRKSRQAKYAPHTYKIYIQINISRWDNFRAWVTDKQGAQSARAEQELPATTCLDNLTYQQNGKQITYWIQLYLQNQCGPSINREGNVTGCLGYSVSRIIHPGLFVVFLI
jgi:hypothetical protein